MRHIYNKVLLESDIPWQVNDLSYCFIITPADTPAGKKKLLLCSENKIIQCQGDTYYPYSGLVVKEGSFNDSAQNEIIIHGIFEKQGIKDSDYLVGAEVKILFLLNKTIDQSLTYICTEFEKNDLDFSLKCVPEAVKYNRSLLILYSKTCRADFGDTKCKVDRKSLAENYEVEKIINNMVYCKSMNKINGYFQGGTMIFYQNDQKFTYKILSHIEKNLESESLIEPKLATAERVTLIPGCDKSFETCCKKYNNAVNFRGEPFIPDFNFLKN